MTKAEPGPDTRQELARLLKSGEHTASTEEIEDFIAGLAAAPGSSLPGQDGSAESLSLVAPEPDSELGRGLARLVKERAERFEHELAESRSHERVAVLRAELAKRELEGFVVPLSDEHNNEFLPKRARRLAWLTGFTGSAGLAVVLKDKAAIFVDGRYTLQVRDEVDEELFTPRHLTDEPPTDWIVEHLGEGRRLGYDPWLHAEDQVKRLGAACEKARGALVAVDDNPLDAVWPDQPPQPIAAVTPHDIAFAGEASHDKRLRMAETLKKDGADACVITAPDSLAWLLNIRGRDVPCTPLPLGFAILHADASVDLFLDPRKVTAGLDIHLGNAVRRHPPEALAGALAGLGEVKRTVRVDPATAAAWIFQRLEDSGATIRRNSDPCALPKACKNDVELDGIRAAHLRDGAALTRFLAWLAETAPGGDLDELTAAARLAAFRAENERIQSLSFETIAGSGPNGAVVHYRSSEKTNRRLQAGELFLLDSGAQYLDGTTDVTRTVAIGAPSAEMRDRFTRVLKGHIALATARFPEGTTGSQLDTLARAPLWQAGLDFDHGTGHGVGHYLGVHEGPQRISKIPNTIPLKPGMIVSNEPGYYKAGAYGIRIENLVAVIAVDGPAGAERTLLGFETLTRAPLDRHLVELELMSADEIAWLDAYHARVRADLSPLVDGDTAAWLDAATRPLGG